MKKKRGESKDTRGEGVPMSTSTLREGRQSRVKARLCFSRWRTNEIRVVSENVKLSIRKIFFKKENVAL